MRRNNILPVAAALAAWATPSMALPGPLTQVGATTVRTSVTRDSARAQSERLLLKFDSLRNLVENERLSKNDRARLEDEMHHAAMSLRELLDETPGRPRVRVGFVPRIAIPGYSTRGYLGVSFDGPSVDGYRDGERFIRFLDYPRIELVEPSSPAERAGIHAGDSLLAFNGDDVRQREFSLTKLLVPEQRVVVRVRRDGSPMDFSVMVAEAPGYVVRRMNPSAMAPPVPMPVSPAEPAPRRARVYYAPEVPYAPQLAWNRQGLGGAQLLPMSEEWVKALGAKSGVLVARVDPGTPAYESGLRDADVIVRAGDKAVSNVSEVRALMERADRAPVKLVIMRQRKLQVVTLSW